MKALHPNNVHNKAYDFELLVRAVPALEAFVLERHGRKTLDFANAKAVKLFNTALLSVHYQVAYWEFPSENLCPPIPGRVDYIHYLNDLPVSGKNSRVLDIGTGATCVYPILGKAVYNWDFVGTDIDPKSLKTAATIVGENGLEGAISFRHQRDKTSVLKGIVKQKDKFQFSMCNPPFYRSAEEAAAANSRKTKNLKTARGRNFSGNTNELWYQGGEKAFLHTYLYESSLFPELCEWFTSLVSKKDNILSLKKSAKKLGVQDFRIIDMQQGNKLTRIACWRY